MLERCRFYHLRETVNLRLMNRRSALLLGDGDGRFLARLMGQNPRLRAEAVDASVAMLQLLQKRVTATGAHDRLVTRQADIRGFSPNGEYDIVATHFFLDCLTSEEVADLARRIRSRLMPGAFWIVSDFAIPTGAAAIPSRLVVTFLYAAFDLLAGLKVRTLPRHSEALRAAGLTLIGRKEWLGGLLFSELWELEATAARTAVSH